MFKTIHPSAIEFLKRLKKVDLRNNPLTKEAIDKLKKMLGDKVIL